MQLCVGGQILLLAWETTVNQIVKDEGFLSSHLEWTSLSPIAAQKREIKRLCLPAPGEKERECLLLSNCM